MPKFAGKKISKRTSKLIDVVALGLTGIALIFLVIGAIQVLS